MEGTKNFSRSKIKNICEGIRRSPLNYTQSVVAANLLAGGLANFHFLIADFPRSTIREWDSLIINTLKKKLNIGGSTANIHFTLPCLAGQTHFVPLESLCDSIQIGEAGFIRLNDNNTMVGRLTRARLQKLADLRTMTGCPLRYPTNLTSYRNTNHMVAVENSLHNLGLTLDTDTMISPQPRTYDIPMHRALEQQQFETVRKMLASKHLTFIGHIATEDGQSMINMGVAQDILQSFICEEGSHKLLAHLTVSSSKADTHPAPPSIAEKTQTSIRKDQYNISSTPPTISNAPPSAPRLSVSDGSMREGKAAFATLPLQNCTTSCTGRVIGKQNVAKSEILGCYAAAKDTPEGQSIINILDNLGVVTTLNRGPPRFSRHRLRRNNRTSWNLLFGTIENRHITMSGLWMKGHTKRTSIVNKLQNETDKQAGIATNNNDIDFNRFPLFDEDFLVFDNKGDLIECDVKLAAIQRAAQVQYIKFREKHLTDNNNPSTLINFSNKLIMKLGGAHNIDKTSQSTLCDPSQHRLIIHARSNSLPSGTRLHKLNPAAFPMNTCPLCNSETDTPAHALWECSTHKKRLEILTKVCLLYLW